MLHRELLHPYQGHAIDFMKSNDNCAVYAGCGLGKTVSTATAYADMRETFDARRALVIAPLRVARRVWSDEVKEWSHLSGMKVARMVGDAQQRLAALHDTSADLWTINRENVSWLESRFVQNGKQIKRWPWDTVILDESSSFKTQGAMRYKSLRRLRRLFPRMIQLTGTPMPNGHEDLWSQIYLLDQGKRLGTSMSAFKLKYFDPPMYKSQFARWTLKEGADQAIRDAIGDIVLVLREEELLKDLPPVQNNYVKCSLSPAEMKMYREFEREAIMSLGDEEITAVNAGVLWGKLLQLASGAVYFSEKQWKQFHTRKMEALWELLESLEKPVLIGYGFRHCLERVFEAAGRTNLGTFAILKSDASFDAWRKGEIDFGLIHPASAGHGLNDLYVSGSTNIVWYDLTNNLEHYMQLNGRLTGGLRRAGRHVVVHHLLAEGTIDDEAVGLLNHKAGEQSKLKIHLAQRLRHATH